MGNWLSYLLATNALLLLLALYFRLFLVRQPRFAWNRGFVLLGIAAALILPMLRWDVLPTSMPNPNLVQTLPEIVILPASPMPPSVAAAWSAGEITFAVYAAGVFLSLGMLLLRHIQVWRKILGGRRQMQDGFWMVETSADFGPASYFKFIFWPANPRLNAQGAAVALAHERCHSRQWHSLDLLLIDLLKAFCWFNPGLYLLRKDLRNTHEFLADRAALAVAGPDGIKQLILQERLAILPIVAAHQFHSHIKARLTMLNLTKFTHSPLRYWMVAPLAAIMVACTSIGQASEPQPINLQAATPNEPATNQGTFRTASIVDLDDILLQSLLPKQAADPQADGVVCLGEQPETLNLDTVMTFKNSLLEADQPVLLNRKRIVDLIGYPQEALSKNLKGKVLVKVLVDESGRVIRYNFLEENDPILRDAVAAHVEKLLFNPGKKAGIAAKWWVIVPFRFGPEGC